MLDIFWNLAMFIVTMGILITVHEFGHFLVARSCGVHIERFSIGFGRCLWKYINRHGTEFVIALIPLGGYVKMLNEHVETVSSESAYYAFNKKTVGQRSAIITAGLIANFIFAIFVYWIVFVIGIPVIRPIVGEVIANSLAAGAEITPGMEIKEIDGIETPDWSSVRLQLMNKIGNKEVVVSTSSLKSNRQQKKILNLQNWYFDLYKEDPVLAIGIHPCIAQIEMTLTKVRNQYAGEKAGLQVGDKIVKVNGQLLTQWATFSDLVCSNIGKSLILEIERKGNPLSLILIPDKKDVTKKDEIAGIVPKVIPLPDEYKKIHQYKPYIAIFKAIEKTWQLIKLVFSMLKKLITDITLLNNLSGPISIAQGAKISAKFGLVYYLMFLAFISINLGIINLFPLPILDGGHLLFLLIEKLKGSPISERVQNYSYRVGSILLLVLMIIAFFNDFSRLLEKIS